MRNKQAAADHLLTTLRGRQLLWIDGVNSAVMGKLVLATNPNAEPVHCDLGDSVHPDSHRFINDLERWYGKPITRIASAEYSNVDEVFEARHYLSGPNGAPCTGAMKVVPRMNYQLPSDVHFWGYTADKLDAKRFTRMVADYPLLHQRAPLIELGMTKRDTHAYLADHGIKRPYVYDIGMPNGNCLCCVKSSSPYYWSHQRHWFPEAFARRVAQCRKFGARIVIIGQTKDENGKRKNIRIYPDEIPADWPTIVKAADFGGCGFHCPTELAA